MNNMYIPPQTFRQNGSGGNSLMGTVAAQLGNRQPQQSQQGMNMSPQQLGQFMKKKPATGGSSPTGASNWAGAATPAIYAYLIGKGKMLENENPGSAQSDALLAGLGPSFNQIKEDPVGMGLPTALGAPFLTPFTGSDKAKAEKPEWAGLWEGIGL